jgi:hypothetical protein
VDDRDLDIEIAVLLAEEGDDSEALAQWKDRLSGYVDGQGALDALRLRSPSEPPWPAAENPMLGYLSERSHEIANADGLEAAVAWLARNAWFEGAIAERARITRLIDED